MLIKENTASNEFNLNSFLFLILYLKFNNFYRSFQKRTFRLVCLFLVIYIFKTS